MYIKSTHCQDVDTFWMHVQNTLSLNDISLVGLTKIILILRKSYYCNRFVLIVIPD